MVYHQYADQEDRNKKGFRCSVIEAATWKKEEYCEYATADLYLKEEQD